MAKYQKNFPKKFKKEKMAKLEWKIFKKSGNCLLWFTVYNIITGKGDLEI